jgi:hypothetical protein
VSMECKPPTAPQDPRGLGQGMSPARAAANHPQRTEHG